MVTSVIKKNKAGRGDPEGFGLATIGREPPMCQTQCQACSMHDEMRGRRTGLVGRKREQAPYCSSLSLESV